MTPGPTRPPSEWIDRWGIVGLLVVTAGVYAGVVTHPFDYDDVHSLVENRAVHGLGSFGSLWTSPTAVSADGSTGYRPVLLSVWAIQYAMFGADPSGYHIVNLLLHLGVIILTWRLGAVAFGDRRAALIAAALVALHPLHTESVNYITAQSSLLVTFGMTAALLLTTEASRREGRGRLIWSCGAWAAAALAMGAKEVGVVFAVLVVLWEWFREGTGLPSGRSLRRALPFALVALAFVLVRQWVLAGETWRGAASPDPLVVLATVTKIIALSLGAWLWPVGLSVDHGDVLVSAPFAWMWVAGAVGAVAAAAMLALRCVRTPLLALAWTAVSLAPLGAVVLLTRVALFQEHRVYPAGAGLALLLAPLIARQLRGSDRTWRPWPAVVAVAALIVCAGVIRDRTEQWGDRVALWSDAVGRYPDSLQARQGLVAAYLAAGAMDRAESLLRETVRLYPGDYQTLFALADLLMKTGRWEEGQALNQRIVEAQIGRSGMALLEGDLLASQGRWEAAAIAYRQAEAAGGRGAELDVRLGAVAERLGDVAEAERRYRRAVDETVGGQAPSAWRQRALDGLAKLGAER